MICSPVAHIETDECGGPEFFSNGSKLLVAEAQSDAAKLGKLTPDAINALVTKRSDIHYPRPKVVSITQATEMGTVYSVDEVREISWMAKKHHLRLHMDGARFANAVAHLGCRPAGQAEGGGGGRGRRRRRWSRSSAGPAGLRSGRSSPGRRRRRCLPPTSTG